MENRRTVCLARLLTVLVLLLALCAVSAVALADTDFVFSTNSASVFEGETLQLRLLRQGAAASGTVEYRSANQRIATVDQNGVVTGLTTGEVYIYASLTNGNNTYNARLYLNVYRKVTDIEVNERNLTILEPDDPSIQGLMLMESKLPVMVLYVGWEDTFSATCLPMDASNRRWQITLGGLSTDETQEVEEVKPRTGGLVQVKVDETDYSQLAYISGSYFEARKNGECIMTFSSLLNPEVKKQYHLLIIQRVRSVSVSGDRAVKIGGTVQLKAEVSPATADIKDVVWSSENENVATVDQNGVVTGRQKGYVDIRATAKDGSRRYATLGIRVEQQPTGLQLSDSAVTVAVGYNKQIRATVLPSNANNQEVTWTSSDTSIAKINNYGYITPVKAGTCTFTCSANGDPSVQATVQATITQPISRIRFTTSSVTVNVGETAYLDWVIEPQDATSKDISLTVNNTNLARISQDGIIWGLKRGETEIVARALDGSNRSAWIDLHVLQPVEGVHMQREEYRVGVGEYVTLTAELEPSNASNTHMTWTSADPTIATISGENNYPVVRGRRWGDTTVTGVTQDGGFVTTCTIHSGSFDKALRITDFYLQDNKIKMTVQNESNMVISRFYFTVEVFGVDGKPLPVTTDGSNVFEGSYGYSLMEMETTRHGSFYFRNFVQPTEQIGYMTMAITGYRSEDGYSRTIQENRQIVMEYTSPNYHPEEEAKPTEEPAQG